MGGRRPCAVPGCPELLDPGQSRCRAHADQAEQVRGSRIVRGYDNEWLRLRAWFMSLPANQLCRVCQSNGIVTIATDCDHITPFRSIRDPLRLATSNLQPLCRACHNRKTAGGV